MLLKELIQLNNFKEYWKQQMEQEYQVNMEAIGIQFWIKNANRELREVYEDRGIFTEYIRAFIINNEMKFKYLIETSKQDFLSSETIQRGNVVAEGYNKDYYGGEGKRDKDTENNELNIKHINNFKKQINYKSLIDNDIIKTLQNDLFETFYFGEEKW